MKIFICANGADFSPSKLRKLASESDFVIAADGGANLCAEQNIIPDVIIGDFDSITARTKHQFRNVKQIHLQEQETTDLEKALHYAANLKPESISVCSLFGERLDHTFANAIIMQNFAAKHSLSITLYDDYGTLRLWKPGDHKIKPQIGKTVSFFSFGLIKNLTLQGFRYELVQNNYSNNFLGISNEYVASECLISFSEGLLFHYENA